MKTAVIRDGMVAFLVSASLEEAIAHFPSLLCVAVGDRPCEEGWVYRDGEFIAPEIAALSLEAAIAQKQREVQDFAQVLLEQAVAGYSNVERDTWFGKETEAKAFLETGDPDTAPHLAIEAAAAGIPLAAIASIVAAKSAALKAYSAFVLGTRSRHFRTIAESSTVEAALSYNFSEGWNP